MPMLTARQIRKPLVPPVALIGLIALFLVPSFVGCRAESSDRATLVALYNTTNGLNWANKTHWLSDRPLGEWYGVTTDASGRVTELILSDNQLSGRIPTGLGNLANLRMLSVNGAEKLGHCGGGIVYHLPDD